MATQVQLRRGTTAQNAAFTGVEGEVTFDTQTHRLLTHDGVTVGGFKTAMLETLNVFTVTQTIGTGNQIILQANGASTFSPAGGGQVNIDPTLSETVSFEGSGIDVGGGESFLIGGNLTFETSGGGSIVSIDSDGPSTPWSISGTGAASFGTGSFTIGAAGLLGFADGVRQTFNPNGVTPGLNFGSNAGDPITPSNGDVWYNSTSNKFRARENGVSVDMIVGGGSPPFVDTTALVMGSVDPTKLLRFEVDGFTAATTRVLTPQNANYTIAGLETVQTFTALNTMSADGIGATPTDRLQLSNTTAAAAGAQQYSPALRFTGQGWKTNAVAASQPVDWRIYVVPVQGAANPTANFLFQSSINGAAFSTRLTLDSSGVMTTTGSIALPAGGSVSNGNSFYGNSATTDNLLLGAVGEIAFGLRVKIKSSGGGLIELFNNAETDFSRLNFGGTTSSFPAIRRTTTALNIRLADDSADAGLTALSITTSQTTFMHITSASLANGAAAAAGTLSNAPAAGNPTKWIPINDNGTTRHIPAW